MVCRGSKGGYNGRLYYIDPSVRLKTDRALKRLSGGNMKTCCVCGTGYKSTKEDILIYGCRICHKGNFGTRLSTLKPEHEIMYNKEGGIIHPYGN